MNSGENISRLLQADDLATLDKEQLRKRLEFYVNDLLVNDFQQMVQILYRIDVSEAKLKALLHQQKDTDAAVLITKLILERLEEKQKTRKQFRPPPATDEFEKW